MAKAITPFHEWLQDCIWLIRFNEFQPLVSAPAFWESYRMNLSPLFAVGRDYGLNTWQIKIPTGMPRAAFCHQPYEGIGNGHNVRP